MGRAGALALGALLLPVNATWAQKADEKREVRVIVTTDDDGKAVVRPDEKTEVTSMFFAPAIAGDNGDQTLVLSAAPFIVNDDGNSNVAFTVASDVNFVSTDDDKSNVSIVIKTDDSSITVTADSIEDALKKLGEQIKTLKTKEAL